MNMSPDIKFQILQYFGFKIDLLNLVYPCDIILEEGNSWYIDFFNTSFARRSILKIACYLPLKSLTLLL